MTTWTILTTPIEHEPDVSAVRQRARRVAELLGFEVQDQTRIATAVSEITRNALSYAGGGLAEFRLSGPDVPQYLLIRIADRGPGIANLDEVLAGAFESRTGMGLGLIGARRLMDDFEVTSAPGGTVVTLHKLLPKGRSATVSALLAEITRKLAADAAADPMAELRTQNRELVQSLAELKARQDEVLRLNEELETTNKGVVALYAELDRRAGELAALNETLEERVNTAVAERAQAEEALRQSSKMEAVGQLTGGLAHDFNNLLTGITGSLELLQTRVSQGRLDGLERYVATAQGAATRAAALTHRLLAFSRRQTLDPKPTDVLALVGGMADLIRRTVGPQIALELVGGDGLWPTLVDANQLENALLNLCINARDAMPDGGRLTVQVANVRLDAAAARAQGLEPGPYVELAVRDTGAGMPADVLAHAFDPFFTTKPIGLGTGLGLSMVYGFVRQSGGQAHIESTPGQGTSVTLYLPRHMGGAVAEAAAEDHATGGAGRGETVLVIDDEPTIRMLASEVLGELGYMVIEAGDGASGLQVLGSQRRIDLLITDVGLPGGMNGRQIADAAREQRPGLQVLFITGYAENVLTGRDQKSPWMHVLTKPFGMQALARLVGEILGGK